MSSIRQINSKIFGILCLSNGYRVTEFPLILQTFHYRNILFVEEWIENRKNSQKKIERGADFNGHSPLPPSTLSGLKTEDSTHSPPPVRQGNGWLLSIFTRQASELPSLTRSPLTLMYHTLENYLPGKRLRMAFLCENGCKSLSTLWEHWAPPLFRGWFCRRRRNRIEILHFRKRFPIRSCARNKIWKGVELIIRSRRENSSNSN